MTTLPNIAQTTTTPVGTMTGATQGGSNTGNPGNSTGDLTSLITYMGILED